MEETDQIKASSNQQKKPNNNRRRRRPQGVPSAKAPAAPQNAAPQGAQMQNGVRPPRQKDRGDRTGAGKGQGQERQDRRPRQDAARENGQNRPQNKDSRPQNKDGRATGKGGRRPQFGRGRRAEVPDDMEIRSYHNDYVAHFDTDDALPDWPGETRTVREAEDVGSGIVIGRNAVRELLRSERAIDKLLVRRGDREGSIVVLVAEAVSRGIPVVEADKNKLDALSGGAPHQGVIAMAAEKEYVTVDEILKIAADRGEAPLIVVADGIVDPYNLGALIRCAEGAGAHGLIIPKRRAVGLTPVVTKASAGAIEHLAIAKVTNISAALDDLKKRGVWTYAAEAGGTPYYETDFAGPAAIVFGSEGDGIQDNVKKKCDFIVSIPMYGQVNSFNVSTAASVLLCEAARRHRTKVSE